MLKVSEIVNNFLSNKQLILFFLRKNYKAGNLVYSDDIQNLLGIKKSYASSLLSDLEGEGLIYRINKDKYKQIHLTNLGLEYTHSILVYILTKNELKSWKNQRY